MKMFGLTARLAIVLVMMSAGCVDNDKSLVIQFVSVPEDECGFSVQSGGSYSYRATGLLDVGYGASPSYVVGIQVHNYLVSNMDENSQTLDAFTIQVEKAEIKYEWLVGRGIVEQNYPGLLVLESQTHVAPLSGSISAAGGFDKPGRLTTVYAAIPYSIGETLVGVNAQDALNIVLGVKMKIFGTTVGGSSIYSNEFVFPVQFCNGCLIKTCADGSPAKSCFPGQDRVGTCS
jgi:hypothetical protein